MMTREDMIKYLDIALANFQDDHKYASCVYCKTYQEPIDMQITFTPGHAKFCVYRWDLQGWMTLNTGSKNYSVCPACIKSKGLEIKK